MKQIKNNPFKNKNIVVTGGLGSIGSEIVKRLLKYNPKKITLIDNRETGMFYSKLAFPEKIVSHEMADIRDSKSINYLLKDADLVFHVAAMKHVIICEHYPFEAIKTNVIGTKNVLEACIKNKVGKMILISTDKAANPLSLMGATKLLAEKMVSAYATTNKGKTKTKFGIIRFGNVLHSRGSVLEIWEKQLEQNKKIFLTNGEMTRFFMSLNQAINLIFTATALSENGEVFILKMPSVKIKDLAEAFLQLQGVPKSKIKVIGAKQGEKMHEQLLAESGNIILENKELFVSLPSYIDKKSIKQIKLKGFKASKTTSIISNEKKFLLNNKQIKEVLLKE